MSIGQAYTDILSETEKKSLDMACDLLIDHAFEDLEQLKDTKDAADTWLGIYLPQRYIYKYTPLFFKKFTVCLITVAWKLAQAEQIPLASLAEELAAWTLVREAQRLLQDELEEATDKDNLEQFIDVFFEDLDFEYLFDNAFDGIEETQGGQQMNITSLAFDNWFKPFLDEPYRKVHPYVVD
ncbi:hypothetical protein [Dictyobacter arantiisoli]|uniref:Uncharacterized protein n=1 Tax=Dictyobacter arantiisoli TaxID=2014874 RepID=A0A5A5T8L1_9CHLR|nr:hypothetical protein [Dictyobacter arantiisoli]GCF07319.1 hypothetical protein KDI_08830 [Dictyobacter arantiisoli]